MDMWHEPDKEVVKNLAKGTMIAGALGATAGATIGILQQQPVARYAFSSGLNSSLFGMTFMAFRESFLRYQRGKNPYFGLKDSQTMDIDQLWSSTIAGAFTGGVLSGLSRGAKAVPSGTFMFGVIAMGGQYILTKTNRYRQDTILATVPLEATSSSSSSSSSTSTPPVSGEKRDAVVNSILNVLPVHRTDVDDYEVKLRQRLQLIETEQRILEAEVQRRKQLSLASSDAAPSIVEVTDGQDKTV